MNQTTQSNTRPKKKGRPSDPLLALSKGCQHDKGKN